ncbi:hypothetical protein GCM10017744_059800 [Streptomyces antimycoticus]|uniref:Uncharacterized protein n=1 Tax=Streptomyces antimycoticus TaxID=68175 RepID=A0A4D4K9D0_9ACTN|nr:hypothetical protein SANT12839_042380 [Streptomyces antimycoticus]
MGEQRKVKALFVVPGPAGVAVRDRLRVSETDAAWMTSVPNTVRRTRLSNCPGNRTHCRSVLRNGLSVRSPVTSL